MNYGIKEPCWQRKMLDNRHLIIDLRQLAESIILL